MAGMVGKPRNDARGASLRTSLVPASTTQQQLILTVVGFLQYLTVLSMSDTTTHGTC